LPAATVGALGLVDITLATWVYAGDAALPAALYAVVRAHLPSLCSVLEQRPPGRGRRRLSTRAQAA
jgi:hypothetical protein